MSETATNFDIESLPVTITYAGQTQRDDNWDCGHWRVCIGHQGRQWTTDYYTGLGLRTPIPAIYLAHNPPRKGTLAYAELEKLRKPVKPKIADVLHCLFMDASAADYNFDDWCATFGYSNDSIKAMNTYKDCLEIAAKLRSCFTREQREAIEKIVQEM